MTRKLTFSHEFSDPSEDGCLSIETDVTGNQEVRVEIGEGDKIWISANRSGWLHLARICAELGLSGFEEGYHFHKGFDFKSSDGTGPEVSFEVRGD